MTLTCTIFQNKEQKILPLSQHHFINLRSYYQQFYICLLILVLVFVLFHLFHTANDKLSSFYNYLKGYYLSKSYIFVTHKKLSDMIDALLKRVSVTFQCYEIYAHRGNKVQLLMFRDQSRYVDEKFLGKQYPVSKGEDRNFNGRCSGTDPGLKAKGEAH